MRSRARRHHHRRWGTAAASIGVAAVVALMAAGPVAAKPDQPERFDFGGLTRTYTVHLPADTPRPQALVLNLHGRGSTGQLQRALSRYDEVADTHRFVVVYPDGVDRSWADGRGDSQADRRGVDDVGFLTALVAKLVRDHGIPPGRVFATGFSNGAFMTNRLACDRADVFAAIAPVAGTLDTDVPCAPSRPVAVLTTHGTADKVVPFAGGTTTRGRHTAPIVSATGMADRWRAFDGCSGPPVQDRLPGGVDASGVTRFASSSCKGGTAVVFMRVEGGGHTWPGGRPNPAKSLVAPTTRAFDVSAASWSFFAAHGR